MTLLGESIFIELFLVSSLKIDTLPIDNILYETNFFILIITLVVVVLYVETIRHP